jgi:hypothetical protein
MSETKQKLKKFSRIVDYIEPYHPELMQVINDLAQNNSFVPRRNGGITFLVPNAKYTEEIVKVAYSDDAERATDMIQSLIIPILLETMDDWKEFSDDVPNLLGKRIDITSVGTDRVLLKNGSIITRNKIFKPMTRSGVSERANMAVWDLNGAVDLEAEPTGRKGGAAVKKRPPKTRNFEADDKLIRDFVKSVEKHERVASGAKGDQFKSVKLTVLCNYYRFLVDHASELEFKEHLDYFNEVLDLAACGGVEAAFYLTWCCRDSSGADGIRRPGLNDTATLAKIIQEPNINLFAGVDKPLDLLGNLTRPVDPDLVDALDHMCQSVRARTVDDLVKLYEVRVANSTGYPGNKFKSIPGLKLLVDEFKHFVSLNWLTFRETYGSRRDAYDEFLGTLGRYGLPHITINNPESQSMVLNVHRLYKANPKEVSREQIAYLNDFIGEQDGCFRESRWQELPDTLRYQSPSQEYQNTELQLSSTTMTEVRNYMAKHGGKLPEGFSF